MRVEYLPVKKISLAPKFLFLDPLMAGRRRDRAERDGLGHLEGELGRRRPTAREDADAVAALVRFAAAVPACERDPVRGHRKEQPVTRTGCQRRSAAKVEELAVRERPEG